MKKIFVVLFVLAAASCATTGSFMPLASEETVLGTVQATFTVRNTPGGRGAINTQAYIRLLEAAERRYSGSGLLDIRDIVWASGRSVNNHNTEYVATGKVVKLK
jgi:hypothetical protein